MSELFFVIKSFFITLAIVFLLQTQWNGVSLEDLSLRWVQQSKVGAYMQKVAQGGASVVSDGYRWVTNSIDGQINKIKAENSDNELAKKFKDFKSKAEQR